MNEALTLRTLDDGGQSPEEVAGMIADFLGSARATLDLAQYDFNLQPRTAEIVGGAIREAAARGVRIRFAYNVDHRNPIPVPPPPEPDVQLIASLPVESKGIAGVPDLMHHKYVLRDGEAVWTGSTNWTDDSWSRQENVIVNLASPPIAYAYTLAFRELWERGRVEGSGRRWETSGCGRGSRPATARTSRSGSPRRSAPPNGGCESARR